MKDIYEELITNGCPGDPDNESGIAAQNFYLRYGMSFNDEVVFIRAEMVPDSTVVDPSNDHFPNAEFMLSIDNFKRLTKMFLRFDEQLTERHN